MPFVKGQKANPEGRNQWSQPREEPPPPPEPKGAPKPSMVLRDMRFVYANPRERDRTEGHRNCRKWLDEAPSQFMTRLTALEEARAKRAQGGTQESPGAASADEGGDRVREILKEIGERFKATRGPDGGTAA